MPHVVKRPVARDDFDRLLKSLHSHGLKPVIVGGQAVNLWATYFARVMQSPSGPVASKDIDVLGDYDLAAKCAAALGGTCKKINPLRSAVPMNAIVLVGSEEHSVQIDFQQTSAPNAHEEITDWAIPLPTPWGAVRVMHPLHCVRSRTFNVVEIVHKGRKKYDNPHGLRQLQAALQIMKAFCRERVQQDNNGPRVVLNNYEELFRFALSPLGTRLWNSKHIDIFSCVEPIIGLPEMFYTKRYPQMWEYTKDRR